MLGLGSFKIFLQGHTTAMALSLLICFGRFRIFIRISTLRHQFSIDELRWTKNILGLFHGFKVRYQFISRLGCSP